MMKRLIVVIIMAFSGALFAEPTVWHVDRQNGDDAAAALDSTGATSFQSIQAAVNKADSGDTILVGPGVYDNVTGTDSKGSTNRVWITGKTLTLRSTDGADKTHIVGRWDTRETITTNGCGGLQIRCVCVNNSPNTVIQGFTLRDGATRLDRIATGQLNEDIPQLGGGLAVYSAKKEVYLIDCVVSNCTACWGGAMRGGTAVRCLITGNFAYSLVGGARQANLYSCIVTRNTKYGCNNCECIVNCTLAENDSTCAATQVRNCLFGFNNTASGTLTGCVQEKDSSCQMYAPMFRDYRLLKGSVAETAGDAASLSGLFAMPEGCAGKDFFGNPFPVVDGKTTCGAIAESVEPVSGAIRFTGPTIVDGVTCPASYAFFDSWPRQICVRPVLNTGETFFRYSVTGASSLYSYMFRYLHPDGSLWIVPPYGRDEVMTCAPVLATKVIWADANYAGGDSDGTKDKPYAVLQTAVDSAAANTPTVIYLKEGEYDRGGRVYATQVVTNRVVIEGNRTVLIKGVGDMAKTVIRGKADHLTSQQEADYPGCGPASVRCICMPLSSYASAVQGVTIADGFSDCDSWNTDNKNDCGGAIYGSLKNGNSINAFAQILDCVITNCGSIRSTFYAAGVFRSRIYNCRAWGGVTRYGVLSSTYCDSSNTIGASNSLGASINSVIGSYTATCHLTAKFPTVGERMGADSLFQIAGMTDRWSMGAIPYYGSVTKSKIWASPNADGYTVFDPQFVDLENGDLRVLSTSRCFGGGNFSDDGKAGYADAMRFYANFATCDINGQPIRFTNGVPAPGAWQVPVAALTTENGSGSLMVNGSSSATTNRMPESVTVAVAEGNRPLTGFTVNDTTYEYDGSRTSWTFNASDFPADETVAIAPILSTNWYVNAAKIDNLGDGFTPATAKRTFHGERGVMAKVKDGDCVHADEGTYDEECAPGRDFLRRRLVVPAGVSVVADKGPEKTIIAGAAATESGVEGYEVDSYGRGTNAVGCVYLAATRAKKSMVKGFTLTGGRTHYCYGFGSSKGFWIDGCIGGAAAATQSYDETYNALVVDCIVTNNYANRGGAFNSVYAVNCRVFDNKADNGGCSANSFHQGCLIDRNYGANAVSTPRSVWNCTIGANNRSMSGSDGTYAINGSYGKDGGVVNTLCLGWANEITNANNSVFLDYGIRTSVNTNDSRIVNCRVETSLPVDADYAPVIGSNVAVDSADPALTVTDWYGDYDVYGNPRAVNGGRMDVGAVETDWCARYSSDITQSPRFAVTAADQMVEETESRTVALVDGTTLSAEWMRCGASALPYTLSVRLAGEGALKVALNGEAFRTVTAVGETEIRFDGMPEYNSLVFSYSGTGSAEVLSSRRLAGAMMIVR